MMSYFKMLSLPALGNPKEIMNNSEQETKLKLKKKKIGKAPSRYQSNYSCLCESGYIPKYYYS